MLVSRLAFHLPAHLQWTEDEFFAFCEANSELRIEQDAHGNIILMAPTGGSTGNENSGLNARLWIWNDEAKLGYTFDSSTGFRLPDGSMRSPDVAWVQKDRYEALTEEQQAKFLPLAPDFLIELRSPSDSIVSLQKKMVDWIENGVQLAWLIDREKRQVSIYRSNGDMDVRQAHETEKVMLSGEDILPDFHLTYLF